MKKLLICSLIALSSNIAIAGIRALSSDQQIIVSRVDGEVSKIEVVYTNHLDSEIEVNFRIDQQHHKEFLYPKGCLDYDKSVIKFKPKEKKTITIKASRCATKEVATIGFNIWPRVAVKNNSSTYVSNSIRYVTFKKFEKINLDIKAKIKKEKRGNFVVLDMSNLGNSLLTTLGQHIVLLNDQKQKIYSGKVQNEYPYFGPTSKANIKVKIPFSLKRGKYKILIVTVADGGINETKVVDVAY